MNKDVLLGIIIGAVVILFVILRLLLYPSFFQEMRILNVEISRTQGELQALWKAKRRQLWLSLIPFVKYRR